MKNRSQSNKQYTPINGDFYDELEAASTLNQICEITFRNENGQQQHTISKIIDLYTEHGVEYAKLENQIIRLDSIISINGKTEGGGKVDTGILEEDMINDTTPSASTATAPRENALQQHDALGSPTPGDMHLHGADERIDKEGNNENFVGDVGHIGSIGIPQERIDNLIADTHLTQDATPLHQNASVEDNLLGNTAPVEPAQDNIVTHQVVVVETEYDEPLQYQDQKKTEEDFAHHLVTATEPVVLANNQYYLLTVDRLINRIYIKVLQEWDDVSDVTELGIYLNKIAPFMAAPFTLLNDLTGLTPDEDGTLQSPGIPNKDALLNAGLEKVADLVPYDCETLVHGVHSFSVNSLRLRYFKDRVQAESWLTGNEGTGSDMKEGRGMG